MQTPTDTGKNRIALPKGWPRRVRSAVIHTITLAQTTLTHARSVAANSINARIRLKEENDRLRQEILLLREESRIKDPAPQDRAKDSEPSASTEASRSANG